MNLDKWCIAVPKVQDSAHRGDTEFACVHHFISISINLYKFNTFPVEASAPGFLAWKHRIVRAMRSRDVRESAMRWKVLTSFSTSWNCRAAVSSFGFDQSKAYQQEMAKCVFRRIHPYCLLNTYVSSNLEGEHVLLKLYPNNSKQFGFMLLSRCLGCIQRMDDNLWVVCRVPDIWNAAGKSWYVATNSTSLNTTHFPYWPGYDFSDVYHLVSLLDT